MQNQPLLDNISVVLVDAKTPANIGATARCMMNTGLSRLLLVNPLKDRDSEAYKLAAGADEILRTAKVYSLLADAIAEHGLVIGASRHKSRQRKNIRTPREMAERLAPLLARNKVAILFGNEVNGLENHDIALCHELIAIPSAGAFPSLNLSHAVMIVAYEIFIALQNAVPASPIELARTEDLENFYRHMQTTLLAIGFIDNENSERMMFSLRQIFGKSRLDKRDVRILRGILNAFDKTCKNYS